MSNIIEYPTDNVVHVEPGEGSGKRIERFIEAQTKALFSKQGLLARIAPSELDRLIQEFQTKSVNDISVYILRRFRESCNDNLLRYAATLRADTVKECHAKLAEVEANFSAHLRPLITSICEDLAFCQAIPDQGIREQSENAIRENFQAILTEYRRTNNYFNEFLDTQIQGSKLFDQA